MMILLFSCTGCGVCGCTTPTLNGATSTNIRIKTRTFKEQTVPIVELQIHHACMYIMLARLNIIILLLDYYYYYYYVLLLALIFHYVYLDL